MQSTLALVGSGEYLPEMNPVDRYLLNLFDTPPKVVCVPTAAGTEGDAMIDDWAQRGVDHFTRLGASVESVRIWDRNTANDSTLVERVAGADFVYLSGGKPGYLYDTLRDSLAWQAILDVLNKGGLLAGCSAGAMIQGAVFAGFPHKHEGFALWPNVNVIPHFDEIPSAVVSGMRLLGGNKTTVVGVDGYTALVREGDDYQVIGSGGVTIWTKEDKTRHTEGPLAAELLPTSSG
ncbi:MAG: Type 1 glutamine amidotransferase-like domain-containing protein [Chloroflexota bacterium]